MNKESFGAFIAQERKDRELTQRDLADKLHVTDKAVSKWERGLSYPDVTLLEPLAEALDLGVEELMACRRQTAEPPERGEEPMKNLLTISNDTVRRERKRSWQRLAGMLALLLAVALTVVYSLTTVTEVRMYELLLKETVGDTNYLYVKLPWPNRLLKLKCGPDVDFDAIEIEDENGYPRAYRLTCRRNKLTNKGTVTACEETEIIRLGDERGQIGAGLGLDRNWKTGDALFGYPEVFCRYDDIYPTPGGRGYLYTCAFVLRDDELDDWAPEPLLTVKEVWGYTTEDWDDDGMSELIIRTRWEEKPYTVYDLVDGEIVETWPEELDPELEERLMTPWERQAQMKRGIFG